MGGSTKKVTQAAAAAGGFFLGGPLGAAAALAATRSLQGKELLGSDIRPKIPGVPDVPEAPQGDFRRDESLRQATIAQILKRTKRGPGRKALIGTSAEGVTAPIRATERKLRGA